MTTPPNLRVALYWAPSPEDTLTAAGNAWLGRDAETAACVPQPAIPGLPEATAAPRVYGLHATLRPPMRLATGWEEFCATADRVAAGLAPFDLPPLAVTDFSGFLALRETTPCPPLHALADACVRATNPHRLPPTMEELARRRAANLSPEEEQLLQRWGYPHVLQAWRFHVTLSGKLDPAAMADLLPAARTHFAHALAQPRRVSEIAIFTQRDNHPFLIGERLKLRGA